MTGRSLRNGIYLSKNTIKALLSAVKMKGNFEHVDLLPVVLANRKDYSPVIVASGKRDHFCAASGRVQMQNSEFISAHCTSFTYLIYQAQYLCISPRFMWRKHEICEQIEIYHCS